MEFPKPTFVFPPPGHCSLRVWRRLLKAQDTLGTKTRAQQPQRAFHAHLQGHQRPLASLPRAWGIRVAGAERQCPASARSSDRPQLSYSGDLGSGKELAGALPYSLVRARGRTPDCTRAFPSYPQPGSRAQGVCKLHPAKCC